MVKAISIVVLFLVGTVVTYAQRAHAELDSMYIFIGGQVGLDLTVEYPKTLEDAQFMPIQGDTLCAQIEIVDRMKPDTTIAGDIVRIHQRYLVQSFDSGLHYVRPIPVLHIGGEDGEDVECDIPALNVINPFQQIDVDEQTGVAKITDVRDAMDAPFNIDELLAYWPILVGILIAGILLFVGIWYYRRYKARQNGNVVEKSKPSEPCHVVALRELERLKEEKLWQHSKVKEYYSRLTDILRLYITERYDVNALESTTDETLEKLRAIPDVDMADTARMQDILQMADFAKFAKHEPLPDENDMAMRKAVEFVNNTSLVNCEVTVEKG
ncbi:MAG: hypothetical protein HUJ96_02665 [Marinilabiliaceae bacterium]|nr:hypothetical protein [Marinilabiliaceae bacterium]